MTREIRKKSPVPIYGFAGVWLLYCLFFPLLRLTDYVLLIVCAVGAYAILSLLFPGKTEYVKEPEKPVSTGNAEYDALLAEGRRAVEEMARLRGSIRNEEVCAKIGELMDVTQRIFKDLLEDHNDYRQIKRFADFYLPTTIKLINAYDRMGNIGAAGENITGTMRRIEDILDTTLAGYKKQLDALFANQALDIETDIVVLENMLKREGLTGKDF
ncbi:5-bromo-4-chloroindolyl phosphate hydrolysis protein [Sporobacter termitidis DSM 10068]|uniref:5-bromo-4-chloroindolyl phosphate hydrolysis protein n=1 Tax=Sporobacter termitidis DSM 10068 TaxID=1123282 RepID=A0A1M5Y1Q7_9FIRM|nr:5-bromo-4-chloroindolyl phosphate hydrolysis family protein [Sporobacter termitidis]SHI06000.1 5-bromo-4-chloroindolyl phosphate hydrolysis protein [Sporobacter termitidis DSM 10068]